MGKRRKLGGSSCVPFWSRHAFLNPSDLPSARCAYDVDYNLTLNFVLIDMKIVTQLPLIMLYICTD